MQITLENLSNLERKLTITIPSERVEKDVLSELQKIAPKAKIAGFRPGKIPFAIIKKRFEGSARQEVMEHLINESYTDALKKENLSPVDYPKIEIISFKENEPFSYSAVVEVYPEVKSVNVNDCEIKKYISELKDEDVQEILEKLRKEKVTWSKVEREAQSGDQLIVDYTVTIHGKDEVHKPQSEKDVKFVLGNGFMWTDFETPLYKCKVGDEVKFTLKFPDSHYNKDFANQDADFVVKVSDVSEPVYPELNDEFAVKLGIKEGGFENLKKEVVNNMERELKSVLKNLFKAELLEKLLVANPIEAPKALVEKELHSMEQRWRQSYAAAKKDATIEFPRKNYEERAHRFVILGLLLSTVIKENEIKVEQQELRDKVAELASIYDDHAQAVNWYFSNKDRLIEVESSLLEEKAMNHLAKQAKITEEAISYKDAIIKRGSLRE